ncbi:hypothetical protein CISIN_1g035193mg [Citrus sinensis]|uniref:Uncharacterized protein n=1 Tax=Citrus sinensis TaxID=2711 RepID=A0A067D0E4_CITSI|nr:hypothetical protein CISIN_1g035193mg [Citrus sinensis]
MPSYLDAFFQINFKHEIPADRTGDFNMIYDFLRENWNIVKWVALGVVILQNRFRMGRVDLTFRFALVVEK